MSTAVKGLVAYSHVNVCVPVRSAFARDPDGNLIEFTDVALFD